MQTEEASTSRMSGTYVKAPARDQGRVRIERTKSQIERTARVIQEALMEASASLRGRREGLYAIRGRQQERKPEDIASTTGSCTSPRREMG